MTSSTSLPASTRSAVVLIALLQGLALYAAYQFDGHWPFQDVGSRYRWHAWILTIPTAIALTVVNLRDRRLWLHALAGSLVVVALASWVAWNLHGDSSLDAAPLRTPFSLAMAIATFILLPWWQHRLQHGHWRASYDALFQHAWQNGLTLALALFFTGLTWLLLWLWAALFGLLKIDFFKDLFQQAAFISLATGALAGFGVLIGRTQQRAIQITRLVLFAICRGLLPLLSFIAVLFVLSLPFTGLQPLWETRSAASLLLTLALLLITFTNAVYQHDDERPPYPRWLRGLVEGGLFALPVLAGLAIYAMALRIGQHGWTLDRFWGALTALLVAGYAAGYALAPLHRAGRWLQRLEPVNRAMCWVVLAAALLGSSPLLDPVRITLASQRARLLAEPARLTAADALMLRFEVGHRGVVLLRELQKHASVHADARAASVIAQALGRSARWEGPPIDAGARDLSALRTRILLAADSPQPPESWWQAVLERKLPAGQCLEGQAPCVALSRDLDGDQKNEVLLCSLPTGAGAYCLLHTPDGDAWRKVGSYAFAQGAGDAGGGGSARVHAAIRAGKLAPAVPRWPELSLDGGRPVLLDNFPEDPAPSP